MDQQELNLMWGKTDNDNPPNKNNKKAYYPVLYHLLDVAAVTKQIWENMPMKFREKFSSILFMDDEETTNFICFVAALHDIGKISPGFQQKIPILAEELRNTGYKFGRGSSDIHSDISASILQNYFIKYCNMSLEKSINFSTLLGGHHGIYPKNSKLPNKRECGRGKWEEAREAVFKIIFELFDKPKTDKIKNDILFMIAYSGLVTVADWIGSSQDYFPAQYTNADPTEYFKEAKKKAEYALQDIGWTQTTDLPRGEHDFSELFDHLTEDGEVTTPNTMQKIIIHMLKSTKGPSIILMEGPTGFGKTEAAFTVADHCICQLGQEGFYVGLPTQATANAIFNRANDFLYFYGCSNLHLSHGSASMSKEYQNLQNINMDDEHHKVFAEEWFSEQSKRSLLASYGVGTIDQALLSVLMARHFFVRFFGLMNKVVIFDEIHAFDVYTSEILKRLIEWLSAMNCTVVLLSATLPKSKKRELVEAYAGTSVEFDDSIKYPSVTQVKAGSDKVFSKHFDAPKRNMNIKEIDDDNVRIASMLSHELADGGCAAYICNTVNKAQNTYKDFKKFLDDDIELYIFHARFPFNDRDRIEKEIVSKFGKKGNRPHKAVVVATQVIEQSLDIDFDLMISEYCPTDLFLQRIGRLHRHSNRKRPNKLSTPTIYLVKPQLDDKGVPIFKNKIYSSYILFKSWLSLVEKNNICIPDDVEELIEFVYNDAMDEQIFEKYPNFKNVIEQAKQKTEKKIAYLTSKSKQFLLEAPTSEMEFADFMNKSFALTDEYLDTETASVFKAQTRYSEYPGVRIVVLEKNKKGRTCVRVDDRLKPIDEQKKLNSHEAEELFLRHTILYGPDIVQHFEKKTIDNWQMNSTLRYCKAAIFDENKKIKIGNCIIRLDDDMGIVISRKNKKENKNE